MFGVGSWMNWGFAYFLITVGLVMVLWCALIDIKQVCEVNCAVAG